MAKQVERGSKRTCGSCEGKFYDLNRDPITCPNCGAKYMQEKPAKASKAATDKSDTVVAKSDKAVAKSDKAVAKSDTVVAKSDTVVAKSDTVVAKSDKAVAEESNSDGSSVEIISLDEAEAAEAGKSEDEDDLADIETDDVDISVNDDEDAFLDNEDDGDADVTGIVGSPEKKPEES